ncbi:DUF4381 domain-containing protein [Marinibaculum pumilum]|uniref:DUF4381 domain-containing protein n=1 Tax=Marinibaculum pumilum TaxID=1766165 RepID=A0ABV7L6M5_9PROT
MTAAETLQDPAVQETLAKLRDIHLPEAVSAWPPAPGWWLLGGVLLLGSGAGIYLLHRHRRSRRTVALRLLDRLAAEHEAGRLPPQGLAAAVAELLRRTAMARFGRRVVARLHGQAWIDFLNRGGRAAGLDGVSAPAVFTGPVALAVAQGPYAREVFVPPQDLLDAARRWLRRNA